MQRSLALVILALLGGQLFAGCGGQDFKTDEPTCRNNEQNGTETDVDCGGVSCLPCQATQHCIQNADCVSGLLCLEGVCFDASCKNGRIDRSETDVDCGGDSCPACSKGKLCAQASDCIGSVPCTNGKCGDVLCFDLTLDGTETDIDCGGANCGGCSNTRACLAHSDCESLNCETGACAPATCHDGSRNQGEADIDCGDATQLCARCDKGATCTESDQCKSKRCISGVCAAAACTDGIQNGEETGPDCGGPCSPCDQGLPCLLATDCQSQVCKGGLCQPRSCSDGIRNGAETGTDCGGPCVTELAVPQRCANGAACTTNDDCAFKNCTALLCQAPTCSNGVKDPTESGVDCGGNCTPCPPGSPCTSATDCDSKVCNPSTKLCDSPSCLDAVQNGNETDVNCGGVTCTTRCTPGQKCVADSDCASKVCSPISSTCLAPTCTDAVPNGNETGPDCGGGCAVLAAPQRCGAGFSCNVDNDCISNNCCTASSCQENLNKCAVPSCTDGKVNQDETGADCGGSNCPLRCAPGKPCKLPTDCDSGVCTGQICQPPACPDGVKNGLEAGLDCGSVCPEDHRCGAGVPCKGPADCKSLVCLKDAASGAYTVCAEATCTDGVKNGKESCSADHGGGCPSFCPQGSACNVAADCDPTVANIDCINGTCAVPSCKDKAKGPNETDTDCGGTCSPCENSKECKVALDCLSKRCVADDTGVLRCAIPTCTDNVSNQGESGFDCGGSSPCDKCGTGQACTLNVDCKSGICGPDGTCAAPTCADTVQNQDETDKDCGGPNCRSETTACDDGKICKADADCKNAWCVISAGTTGTCATPSCTDNTQNGTETDVNCGGKCPTKCVNDKHCLVDGDCENGWCNGGTCATPTCGDTVKNGSETGADCGGNCAACFTAPSTYNSNCRQCADSVGCSKATDCKSLNCVNNVCAAPPTTASPAMCVGKVLEGSTTSCGACTTGDCLTYLWCFYANNCDPGKLGAYANYCTNGGVPAGGGPCSVNIIKKASTALDAAIKAYRCACP